MINYKPSNYNSLSPYLIVDNAQELVNQLTAVFNATVLRRYDRPDGSIMHIELQLDDSVIMLSNSTAQYPAHKTMLHFYVPDVLATYRRALDNGCMPVSEPVNQPGDPDTRGSFYDAAGNHWSVSTQE